MSKIFKSPPFRVTAQNRFQKKCDKKPNRPTFLSGGVFAPTNRDKSPVWALCGEVGYVPDFPFRATQGEIRRVSQNERATIISDCCSFFLLCHNLADWIGNIIFRQIHLQGCRIGNIQCTVLISISRMEVNSF